MINSTIAKQSLTCVDGTLGDPIVPLNSLFLFNFCLFLLFKKGYTDGNVFHCVDDDELLIIVDFIIVQKFFTPNDVFLNYIFGYQSPGGMVALNLRYMIQ